MMRSRRVIFFLLGAILLVAGYAGYGMVRAGREETPLAVSVIVSSSGSDRWTAFREGLEQGAKEFGVYLNVISAGEIGSIEEEAAIVRREIENGADGIIVEPCAEDAEGLLAGSLTGAGALLVGTESRENETLDTVMPDLYGIGRAVAESVLEMEGIVGGGQESAAEEDEAAAAGGTRAAPGGAAPIRIGILAGNQRQRSMRLCLDGFLDGIGTAAEIAWTLSDEMLAEGAELAAQLEREPVQVVAALDDAAMEHAVDALAGPFYSCRLYGEGRSTKNIYCLDTGVIRALVVPDEYYMGYLSIARISGRELSLGGRGIEYLTVTAETLHDKGTEGILFPNLR